MGAIMTQITLTNPANGKTHTMEALIDTGAVRMALPEDVVHLLDLLTFDTVVVRLATDETRTIDVAGPLFVELVGRKMATDCFVLPAASEALVGQVVLESLDLIADAPRQQVYPRHPQSPYPVLNLK